LQDKHFTLPTTELVRVVQDARERTVALVADLDEAQFEVPLLALVNPFRWELGHVTFFYETFVLQMLGHTTPLLAGAEDLYDSFKIDHDDRWTLPLPSLAQTREYMQRVNGAVVERLQGHEPDAAETYLYLLSVLHEDMHGEAFTYMRQTLGYPAHPSGVSGPMRCRRRWVEVPCLAISISPAGHFILAPRRSSRLCLTTKSGPIRWTWRPSASPVRP